MSVANRISTLRYFNAEKPLREYSKTKPLTVVEARG